jgi:hypothetical protein
MDWTATCADHSQRVSAFSMVDCLFRGVLHWMILHLSYTLFPRHNPRQHRILKFVELVVHLSTHNQTNFFQLLWFIIIRSCTMQGRIRCNASSDHGSRWKQCCARLWKLSAYSSS